MVVQRLVAASVFTLALAGTAAAAPVDDYIVMQAALKINLACGGLKYFEHERTLWAAADYLSRTPPGCPGPRWPPDPATL